MAATVRGHRPAHRHLVGRTIGVLPRYEFRAWGRHLPDVVDAVRSVAECVETRECAETYLLTRSDAQANLKVRRGALDVKVLIEEREGYELWGTRFRSLFPISADLVVEVVFGSLGVEPVELRRETYTLPQLIEEVVEQRHEVTAVDVSKTRRAYVLDGCLAEIADVVVAGTELQTAAVESTEIAPLERARALLGLDDRPNTSYPVAIREAIGW